VKDNFCEFTYYIILAHHNFSHSIYHMIKSYYIVCEFGPWVFSRSYCMQYDWLLE